ncbi:MAG: isoprenylcysteine carboxylmethyltransferase family protein [Gammaproteobacteria bacterium]|nr:isoprenylcysteine carboxylmethyltransferase family protein [Gammaproteobacteria bacterium]
MATLIFWPAGSIDWFRGWLYIVVVTVNLLALLFYVQRVNPGLIEQRQHIGEGTKRWDNVLMAIFAPLFLSIYVVAGFDVIRFVWTTMSAWWWPVGMAVLIPGTVLYAWSMGVNPFFEKTVRIQTERSHRVIDTGPYAFVRHPGYLGFFGWCLSAPLLLGSWWALVPALLSILGLVIRTALEDRTLREELAGYHAYTNRVRYRLIPGLW